MDYLINRVVFLTDYSPTSPVSSHRVFGTSQSLPVIKGLIGVLGINELFREKRTTIWRTEASFQWDNRSCCMLYVPTHVGLYLTINNVKLLLGHLLYIMSL